MLNKFVIKIPAELNHHSGKVFYSGRQAFSNPANLYILGENPGGDPTIQTTETVSSHSHSVIHDFPDDWSAYANESWAGHQPGTFGMAPRILHLLDNLKMPAGTVPASNIIFVRSRREQDIKTEFNSLAEKCWEFHETVIDHLKPKVILCLGKKTGKFVRLKLGANRLVDSFTENNQRKWRSEVFISASKIRVIIATHPSIADWTNVDADPTPLIYKHLNEY